MEVAGLYIYPVKSCAGVPVQTARITSSGFENDRRWAICRADCHRVLHVFGMNHQTVRIQPILTPDDPQSELTLTFPGMEPCKVPRAHSPRKLKFIIMKTSVEGMDKGDEVASWLQTALQIDKPLRLVERTKDCSPRPNGETTVDLQGTSNFVNFANQYSYLFATQSSLDQLNAQLGQLKSAATARAAPSVELPLSMARFRPNVVIKGSKAYTEDSWREVVITDAEDEEMEGEEKTQNTQPVRFRWVHSCSRCQATTVDPLTAEMMKPSSPTNPLTFLKNTRNKIFGAECVAHEDSVGEEVKVGQVVKALTSVEEVNVGAANAVSVSNALHVGQTKKKRRVLGGWA